MRVTTTLLLIATTAAGPAAAQDAELEARVWLDRGDEPVLQRGEDVRVYYRTSFDAYTATFRIDTDGVVTLINPAHPGADSRARATTEYRLLFPGASRWTVRDEPGVGYFFIVASPRPLDFSSFRFVPGEERWDLGSVGARVYEDPYLAIDDFVAALVPDWDVAEYTLDFISYSVGESHDYPRFLCYDCHDQRPYPVWNPYTYACSTFRVVIWDDPYFYPAYRYSGLRVVFTVPLRNRPRYTVVRRGPGEGWSPVVRVRSAPPVPSRTAQYKEPGVARGGGSATPTRRPAGAAPTPTRAAPTRTATPRRPSAAVPSRAAPSRATPSRRPSASPQRATQGASPARSPAARASWPATRSTPSTPPRSGAARPGTGSSGTTTRSATPPSTRSRPSLLRRPSTSLRSRVPTSGGTVTSRPPTARSRVGATLSTVPGRTSARPSASRSPSSRPAAGRSLPGLIRNRPSISSRARAPSSATRARPTVSRPTPRATPSRPTVRARPKTPPRRGGRGGG